MPKNKSVAASVASKRPRAPKKTAPRTIHPKKKSRSVLIDVIEDEPISLPVWPGDNAGNSLPKGSAADVILSSEELDQQKRFYSELAAQVKTGRRGVNGKTVSRAEDSPRRPVGLYRRLVIRFVILVLFIAAAVAYFSFSKLTIVLNLKGESLNNNLLLKVSGESATASAEDSGELGGSLPVAAYNSSATDYSVDPRETVDGTIKTVSVSVSQTYPATGETFLGDAVTGRVRIINNYTKNQSLVATTRLLTPDNKLFRIKEAVNVPAGGEVTVEVYADKPSADMAVGPVNFTIPGLWAGLQDKIYAKSDEAFVFTKKVKKHVNASDLELAAKDINTRLLEAARVEAETTLGSDWLYQSEGSPELKIDAKIGEAKDEFTASASGRIIAVSFDKQQAASLAQAKLNLIIPEGKELADFQPERIAYSLDNYDPETKSATIKAVLSGTMILKKDSSIIDPRQLVNLSADQIGAYLRDRPEIKEYELNFSPSFIRKAPSLADRIKIEINKN